RAKAWVDAGRPGPASNFFGKKGWRSGPSLGALEPTSSSTAAPPPAEARRDRARRVGRADQPFPPIPVTAAAGTPAVLAPPPLRRSSRRSATEAGAPQPLALATASPSPTPIGPGPLGSPSVG